MAECQDVVDLLYNLIVV